MRLNCLKAKTRIKLNFLDHLAKFWELQVILIYMQGQFAVKYFFCRLLSA